MYTQTGIGALRLNRSIVVVTALTCKTSLTLPLIHDMAALKGKVTPSIVGAWTGDCAQLTSRNGLVLMIIASNVSDAP